MGFVPSHDVRPAECSIWEEDCPRGEKCMPYANDGGNAWNDVRCVPIAPDAHAPGQTCMVEGDGATGIDDCALHSMCLYVDPSTGMGTCVAFCVGDANNPVCDDPEIDCHITANSVLLLCLPLCDPFAQDCSEGRGCYPSSLLDGFSCAPDASGDQGATGDPCVAVNECDPGSTCLDADAVPGCASLRCCSPFCDLSEPDAPCPTGQSCEPWYAQGSAPPGYEDVGVCTASR